MKKDNTLHIFKHLHSTITCFILYNSIFLLSLLKVDKANSKFNLEIKEALPISWTKPYLNAQQNNLALTLSPLLALLHCVFLPLFFAFLFHLLFSLSLALIIGIFYCLDYISLLLQLITTLMV